MTPIIERFRSIVVLNGSIPDSSRMGGLLRPGTTLIAADGAAWALKQHGILPDIIVGDLDSLRAGPDPLASFPDSEIIEEPEQDSNDFEKALRLALKRNLAPLLVVGMQGGDLEHSFNNWSVAIKLTREMELWILEQNRIGISLAAGSFLRAARGSDKIVSLIPQPQAVLTTGGLRWPLNGESLALGIREGARNEVTGRDFTVKVESGSVIVFFGEDTEIQELTRIASQ